MSDPMIFGDVPRGRMLDEQPGHERGYVGTLGVLRRADEASLKLARRSLREIPEHAVEGQGKFLLDTTTGETLEVITSFVDLVEPKSTGCVAFAIRDDLIVPLRPVGWKAEVGVRDVGEFYGRKATGNERMPMPTEHEPVFG